ncbi:hypothetical protein HDV06_001461 [Boothiomyces sp. JEL0866]|nr:hypothetical protein HDV06_001461 [Boothiomyces sp. JEL0866]
MGKQKGYKPQRSDTSRSFTLPTGTIGFLVTCHKGKERQSTTEIISIFESYTNQEQQVDESKSIEELLQQELNSIKSAKKKLFSMIPTNIPCTFFIRTNDTIEPVGFVLNIMNEFIDSKIKNTRYTSRIIPISDTCFALMKDIKEMASKTIHAHFDDLEPTTFVVVPKIRNNTGLKNARDELIKMVAEIVPAKHKVDINGAKYSIMLEIMNNVCGISIVTDYNRLKKFNLEQFDDGNEKIE